MTKAMSKIKVPKTAARKTIADLSHSSGRCTLSYDDVLDELQALLPKAVIAPGHTKISATQLVIKSQAYKTSGKITRKKRRRINHTSSLSRASGL